MGFDQFGQYEAKIYEGTLLTDSSRPFAAGDVFGVFRVGAGNRIALFSYTRQISIVAIANPQAVIMLEWTPGEKYFAVGQTTNLKTGEIRETNPDEGERFLNPDNPNFPSRGSKWYHSMTPDLIVDPAAPPIEGNAYESETEEKWNYISWTFKAGSLNPHTVVGAPIVELVAPMDWVRVSLVAPPVGISLPGGGIGATWSILLQVGANAQ